MGMSAKNELAKITVVIADDHPPTRTGVRFALEQDGFEVLAEAADANEAWEAATKHRPDLCLLDIRMPGNGIRAASRITSELTGTAVVMLTAGDDSDDLFDALRAGASGYLLKDTDPDRLPYALKGVLSGEAALPRNLVARLVKEFRSRGSQKDVELEGGKAAGLTPKEWDVLELLREGCSTEQISERLFVSQGTVRTHVASILKKLRVPDRDAAVRLLEESGN